MLVSDVNLSDSVDLSRRAIRSMRCRTAILGRLLMTFLDGRDYEPGKCVSRTGRLPGQRRILFLRCDESHGV